MTAVSDADTTSGDLYADRVEALSRASARLRFDPYVDIDWDAAENALDKNDPRWQLDPGSDPLGATDWYAEQSLERRIDMGRWITANTLKATTQFEMMLIRGVVHYAGVLPMVHRCFGISSTSWSKNAITCRCSRNSSIALANMFPGCGGAPG